MPTRISQQELESYLWGAAVLLRGLIDAGDYKQFIFPLLFYKRVSDVWKEEYKAALASSGGDLSYAKFAENHRFPIPAGAHWDDVRQVSKNVGASIQRAMRAIETTNPDLLDGIFGDAPWTNRERLPDETLKDLIEHFSTQTLSVANVPEDELGNAYEYLIKKFADDSGHTAAEFYTNRTVVHLMTQLLAPQAGESIYDPTCGTGGMLISALDEVKRSGGEYRTLKLYGQERNLITSSIARMNLFLHGVEDFEIIRGDTLADPKHIEGDRLRQFDVILANPPYSIKQWDREAWSSDKWGRNSLGTPPQGRADYAFQQHILTSLTAKGRCAVLWPHGVLFRNEEQTMRAKLIEQDWVEAVIGLGPNLFYNSPMESCIVICNRKKTAARKGKVIFIDALNEVTRERAQSFLKPEHQGRIVDACQAFSTEAGFANVVDLGQIAENHFNLSIPRYVKRGLPAAAEGIEEAQELLQSTWEEWELSGTEFWMQMDHLSTVLQEICPARLKEDDTIVPSMSQDDLRRLLRDAVQFALDISPDLQSKEVLRTLCSGVFVTEEAVRKEAPIAQRGSHVMQMITANEANPEQSRSRKLKNIWISWDKLLDLALDAGVAGYGASAGMVLGVTLAALYIVNKIRKAACEMLSKDDAIAMMALWSAKNGTNQVWVASGLKVTNVLRSKYSLSPLAAGEFSTLLDRLSDLKCLSVSHGVIVLREVVKIRK